MRRLRIMVALAALFVTSPARGGEPAIPGKPTDAAQSATQNTRGAARRAGLFAPMWIPVSWFPPASTIEPPVPVASPAYAFLWEPHWQKEICLSAEQKQALLAMNATAAAEAKENADQFKRLSPEEQKARMKAWAGKPAPWRQELDNRARSEVEAVLTPQQMQMVKDISFRGYAVGLLYDDKMRQEIGFSSEQEDRFRRLAMQRLSRFQAVAIERAEKLWSMLTAEQHAALPAVVKSQGPTSAVLSIAWELGFFEPEKGVPGYAILAESPVRKRLGMSAEQEKKLQAIVEDTASKREQTAEERSSQRTRPPRAATSLEGDAEKQVEALLTAQQLTTLKAIDFRRKMALALGYPEKRKTLGITAEQDGEFLQIDNDTRDRLCRIDREMLAQALETLTAGQRQRLRQAIDRRVYGK